MVNKKKPSSRKPAKKASKKSVPKKKATQSSRGQHRVYDRTEITPFIPREKTGRGANPGKMGRPPEDVSDAVKDQIRELAAIGCPMHEIELITKIPVSTLNRRYSDLIREGRTFRNVSLRRKQLKEANKGNTGMLVWLGKTMLGQTDKVQITEDPDAPQKKPEKIVVVFE